MKKGDKYIARESDNTVTVLSHSKYGLVTYYTGSGSLDKDYNRFSLQEEEFLKIYKKKTKRGGARANSGRKRKGATDTVSFKVPLKDKARVKHLVKLLLTGKYELHNKLTGIRYVYPGKEGRTYDPMID